MNYPSPLSFCLPAVLLGFVSFTPLAAVDSPSIIIIATYDYPSAVNTFAFGINKKGDVAGYYTDSDSVGRGFIRYRDGSLSAPIVDPNDTGNFTQTYGINTSETIVGDYFSVEDGSFHGYLLNGETFTDFDFGPSSSTFIFTINDLGDFAGAAGGPGGFPMNQAFANIGGATTVIDIPGAVISNAYGINNRDVIVGSYGDSAGINHGFFCDSAGNLSAPIDYPGSLSTDLYGISDRGLMIGRFQSSDRLYHGFLLSLPNRFVQFDYLGATYTSLNGINRAGYISGQYNDTAGFAHGFIALLRPSLN